jgi:hypothetical protein
MLYFLTPHMTYHVFHKVYSFKSGLQPALSPNSVVQPVSLPDLPPLTKWNPSKPKGGIIKGAKMLKLFK